MAAQCRMIICHVITLSQTFPETIVACCCHLLSNTAINLAAGFSFENRHLHADRTTDMTYVLPIVVSNAHWSHCVNYPMKSVIS